MTFCRRGWLLSILVVGTLPGAAGAYASLMADLAALYKVDRDIVRPEDKIPPLKAQYARILAMVERVGVGRLSDADLREFFLASRTVSFYASDPVSAGQMGSALAELSKRHLATKEQRQKTLDAYVAARMLDDARSFANEPANVGLARLPAFHDEDSAHQLPTLWAISGDGRTLARHDFPLASEPRLIVVSSPWCGFSRNASDTIAKDPGLADLMKRHSTWVMPQFVMHDFDGIAQWNHDRPDMSMQVVHQNDEWPWITSWGTPAFYFLKDGNVVKTVVGWPGPERLAELRAGFDAIGVR